MFDYIEGTVSEVTLGSVVLEAGGIGYDIMADTFTRGSVRVGARARLYTQLRVADDRLALYGFSSREQRALFGKLTTIPGVGPKLALSILSGLSLPDLTSAVLADDTRAFTGIPGVGKKTAQRLLMELKEKLDFTQQEGSEALAAVAQEAASGESDAVADAALALEGLGYSRAEALKAISAVRALADTPEELVQLALRRFGSRQGG